MKSTVQDDTHDRIERVRRKLLCPRHKIPRGIIDQGVYLSELRLRGGKCGFNGIVIAHIAGGERRRSAVLVKFIARGFQRIFAAPYYEEARA